MGRQARALALHITLGNVCMIDDRLSADQHLFDNLQSYWIHITSLSSRIERNNVLGYDSAQPGLMR